MKGLVNEGDCPACGKTVRYCGYVPRIYLCADCGGEEPHAEGVVERDGRLYYEPDQELVTDGGEAPEYWVAGKIGPRKLHTDRECPYVGQARNYRPARPGEEGELDVCAVCEEGRSSPREQNWSHYRALKEAANAD